MFSTCGIQANSGNPSRVLLTGGLPARLLRALVKGSREGVYEQLDGQDRTPGSDEELFTRVFILCTFLLMRPPPPLCTPCYLPLHSPPRPTKAPQISRDQILLPKLKLEISFSLFLFFLLPPHVFCKWVYFLRSFRVMYLC